MAEQLTIHTGTTLRPVDPTDIEWWAADETGDRHAFPRRDGYPPPAACGVRWTTRHGKQGAEYCATCLAALKDQIRAASAALAVANREALDAGDHFAYPAEVR